jgi:hypothetical protein
MLFSTTGAQLKPIVRCVPLQKRNPAAIGLCATIAQHGSRRHKLT